MRDYEDEPAFSVPDGADWYGMTKREYLAAMAMQGLLASGKVKGFANVEAIAAEYADALLSEIGL